MIFNRIKDKIRRKTKNSSKIIPLIIALVIVIIPAMVFLVSLIFRLLWNWLMPEIFGLPEITILQSIGLLILGRFLFGSFINSKHENKSSMILEIKMMILKFMKMINKQKRPENPVFF